MNIGADTVTSRAGPLRENIYVFFNVFSLKTPAISGAKAGGTKRTAVKPTAAVVSTGRGAWENGAVRMVFVCV
jgi:hypothetical protein